MERWSKELFHFQLNQKLIIVVSPLMFLANMYPHRVNLNIPSTQTFRVYSHGPILAHSTTNTYLNCGSVTHSKRNKNYVEQNFRLCFLMYIVIWFCVVAQCSCFIETHLRVMSPCVYWWLSIWLLSETLVVEHTSCSLWIFDPA